MAVFESKSDLFKSVIWATTGIAMAVLGAGLYGIDFIRGITEETIRSELSFRAAEIESEILKDREILLREIERLNIDIKEAQSAFPTGAVMSFALDSGCPRGWVPYELAQGRVIVGATVVPSESANLSLRVFDTGGSELISLYAENLPAGVISEVSTTRVRGLDATSEGQLSAVDDVIPLRSGGGQPVNNMPPYIALAFCQRK